MHSYFLIFLISLPLFKKLYLMGCCHNRSGISDSGIGMVCNVFPETLKRLLLALCPNVTSSNSLLHSYFHTWLVHLLIFVTNLLSHVSGGIQFATAQLPLLELMDCGMTICDPNFPDPTADGNDCESQKTSTTNLQHINQKLIIKHSRLKKLSLWGCTGLDVSFHFH